MTFQNAGKNNLKRSFPIVLVRHLLVGLPRHCLSAESLGKISRGVGAGRKGRVTPPVRLESGHLGKHLATRLAAEHFRLARRLLRRDVEAGGEGIPLRLVVEVLEGGVWRGGDLVHHVVVGGGAYPAELYH